MVKVNPVQQKDKVMTRILRPALCGALLPGVLMCALQAHAASCESLSTLQLAHTTITLAQDLMAGAFTQEGAANQAAYADLPAFCRIGATISPVVDSEIKIEVWLPAE